MATFLTTRKMSPALAARVEASVRGGGTKRGASGRTLGAPHMKALLRLGLGLAAAAIAASLLMLRHQEKEQLEQARAALLGAVRKESATLTASDKDSLTRAEGALLRFAAPAYEGDAIAAELKAPGALADMVARPVVYVRGPIGAFGDAAAIAKAASASGKDAFLLCLVEPPASRVEKVLLAKVRAAYAAGASLEQRTANARRLYEEEAGIRVLLPPWEDRVRAAHDARELAALRAELERTPIERAKQAARAGLLVTAMDEPADGPGPTDIDGERAHWVRVGVVDLASGRVLLRVRKRVDPSAWSATARAEYSSGLDSCALARDVVEGVGDRR